LVNNPLPFVFQVMFGCCFVLPVSLLPVMEDGLIKGISQVCHYCHLTIDYVHAQAFLSANYRLCACSGLFICMASFVWRWCSSGYTFPSDTWRENIFTAACEIPGSLQVCLCSCPGKNISGHTLPVKLTLTMNLQSGFKFLSCQLLRVQVQGKIIAPNTIEEWNNCQADYWIGFVGVANLNMYGSGLIDGQGSVWWMRAMQASSLNVIIYTYC